MSKLMQTILYTDEEDKKFWIIREKALNTKNRLVKKILICRYYRYQRKRNAHIPLETIIEEVPTTPHGISGIYISEKAHLGKGLVIFHQVTIGSNTLKETKIQNGAPTIGDNCYIGAGAKIIGNCYIGKSCRIGANAVVVKDIPDFSTVVIGEARVIIHDSKRDNSFQTL